MSKKIPRWSDIFPFEKGQINCRCVTIPLDEVIQQEIYNQMFRAAWSVDEAWDGVKYKKPKKIKLSRFEDIP